MKNNFLQSLKRIFRTIGTIPIVIVVLFLEWGWEPLKQLLTWVFHGPFWVKLTQKMASLPPYWAFATFSIPLVLDEAFKLAGLYLMLKSHTIIGLSIIVGSKIMGTAIIAWIYQATESQLMQLPWFARFLGWWIPWKNQLIATVKQSAVWQKSSALIRHSKRQISKFAHAVKIWFQNLH